MDRRWIAALGALLAIAMGLGVRAWMASEEAVVERHREERRAEREREREETFGRLVTESRPLMPEIIRNVALGMTRAEVQAARPGVAPSRQYRDQPLLVHEERMPNGGQVIYGFDRGTEHLVQVQLLSLLPTTDAIPPHLAAMNEQYGRPTGIWDCPTTGGLPTRRFTWRGSLVTVSDVFLVYGERVSLTLYIATTDQIGRSLAMGGCSAVRSEGLERFPVASPDQIQAAAGGH